MTDQSTDADREVNESPRVPHDSAPNEGRDTKTHRTRPEKVTGVQLEARFDRMAQATRDRMKARTPQQSAALTRAYVAGLLAAGIAAMAVVAGVQGDIHRNASAANEDRISALQDQLRAASAPLDGKASTIDMAALDKAAYQAATQVARKQQRFAELYYQAGLQPDAGNGTPNQAMLDTAAHRKELAKNFSHGSFLVDDGKAYTWSTIVDAPSDRVDPRYEWYIRYDGLKASDPGSYAWQVESSTPSLKVDGTAHVIWVCREKAKDGRQGNVLAWASAPYDGKTGVFTDLELVVTVYGAQHTLGAAGAPAKQPMPGPTTPTQGAR